MGGTRSSSVDWSSYSTSQATQSQSFSQAYTNRSGVKDDFKPHGKMIRESVASPANPHPTPVIFGLDCTGSMNDIALSAKKNLGTFMAEVYDRQPVSDPHVMVTFNDDVFVSYGDSLQVTQFEADKVILDQMGELYWVGHGGGNGSESYNLPLHFALNHTSCDAFKEGRKGFIFLMGDDGPPPPLTQAHLQTVYGSDYAAPGPYSIEDLIAAAEENWHVFFIFPTRGGRDSGNREFQSWQKLLGERAIELADVDKLAEVLVATMQVIGGADAAAVAASFTDPGTALVVKNAIGGLTTGGAAVGGIVRV